MVELIEDFVTGDGKAFRVLVNRNIGYGFWNNKSRQYNDSIWAKTWAEILVLADEEIGR